MDTFFDVASQDAATVFTEHGVPMLSPNGLYGSLPRRDKWHFNGSHESREGFGRLFMNVVHFVTAADMIRYARTGRNTLAISEERSGWYGWYGAWWGARWGSTMTQNIVQNVEGGPYLGQDSTLAPGQIAITARVAVRFEMK